MCHPVQLEEAILAVRRDPTRSVRIAIDSELTIEVHAIEPATPRRRSVADVIREIGCWEGERGEGLLFAEGRQRSNRDVHGLA
jgi:hypothetical protein